MLNQSTTTEKQRSTTRHCISVSAATFTELQNYAERRGITMGKAIAQLLQDAADQA